MRSGCRNLVRIVPTGKTGYDKGANPSQARESREGLAPRVRAPPEGAVDGSGGYGPTSPVNLALDLS